MHRFNDRIEAAAGHDFLLDVWHRRKWVAIVVFLAAAAAVISVTRSLPDLYRATATVLVERPQVSEEFVRSSVTAELETRIQTIYQQVTSRARLTDVIDRLNLYPELRGKVPSAALAERMRRDLEPLDLKRAEQTSGRLATIAFSVSYTGRDPAAVVEVVNTLSALYVEENTKIRARQAARTVEFLKAQLADVKRELDAQEDRASEFKMRHDGELPEQAALNFAALERLNTKFRMNSESRSRALERRLRFEEQLASADAAGPAGAPAATLTPEAAQLVKLRQELAGLRRQFSDQYPSVIRVAAEISALEQEVAQQERSRQPGSTGRQGSNGQPKATVDPAQRLRQTLDQVDGELKSLKEEEGFLRRGIAQYEARIENAPKRQQELQQLSSDYDITRERYESLLKRYEDAQIADSLEQGQNVEHFRILDPAIPPNGPAAPNRQWLLLIGLVASLGLAFASVVAAERLDTSFHTLDDLRSFVNVPTLATIRVIPTAADARRRRFRLALMTVLVIVGLALIVAGSHYVASGNETVVRRMARTGRVTPRERK